MKNIKFVSIMLIISLLVVGCTSNTSQTASNEVASQDLVVDEESKTLSVVTTLFPTYDFVRIVGGEKVNVSMIVPPGVEPHSFEPTPKDIISIKDADLFIYTSEIMEPWANKVVTNLGETDKVLAVGENLPEIDHVHEEHGEEAHEEHGEEAHEEHGEEAHDHGHDHGGVDPHIWLDPLKAIEMVRVIEHTLSELDPNNADYYQANAKAYISELDALHHEIEEAVETFSNKTIYSGGHFAFGHFIERYGLLFESPFNGFAPDAEPSPKVIAQLIDEIKEKQIKVIYYEELVNPRVATVIADETDAEMLLLHAAHNLTKEELENGVTFLSIMRSNFENLKKGLN